MYFEDFGRHEPSLKPQKQEKMVESVWSLGDRNQDGKITIQELIEVLGSTRWGTSTYVPFDSGTDGRWNAEDKSKSREQTLHAAALDTLTYHDTNDDGSISKEELRASIMQWNVARWRVSRSRAMLQKAMEKRSKNKKAKSWEKKHTGKSEKVAADESEAVIPPNPYTIQERLIELEVGLNKYRPPGEMQLNRGNIAAEMEKWRPDLKNIFVYDAVKVTSGAVAKDPKGSSSGKDIEEVCFTADWWGESSYRVQSMAQGRLRDEL